MSEIAVNLAILAHLCHPLAPKMAQRPTRIEVRDALLHFMDLAACFESKGETVPDPEADATLRTVVDDLQKHQKQTVERAKRAASVELVNVVAGLYRRYKEQEDYTVTDLETGLKTVLSSWGHEPSDEALDELVPAKKEIIEDGGPKQAAVNAVASLLGVAPRTLHYREKKSEFVIPITAYRMRTGGMGLLRYVLLLFGFPAGDIENIQTRWLRSRESDNGDWRADAQRALSDRSARRRHGDE